MIQLWFKLFYRNIRKNILSTIINISGLTISLIGLILVLLYYTNENSYDTWNPHNDQVYKVNHIMADGQLYSTSTYPEGPTSAAIIPEIESQFTMNSYYSSKLLSYKDKSIYTSGIIRTDENFFDFFPHPLLKGDPKNILKDAHSIVISSDLERKIFGTEESLGQTIKINTTNYIVTGVYLLKKPSNVEPQAILKKEAIENTNWGMHSYHTYYKVAPNTDITSLEDKLQAVFIDNYYQKEANKLDMSLEDYIVKYGSKPFLEPLNKMRLSLIGDGGLEGTGNYLLLMIMLGLSILILLISSINFINLSLSNALERAKEVGIKKTLGESRRRLKLFFALEIIGQCFIALICTIAVIELILPSFNSFIGKDLSLNDSYTWLLVILILLIISLIIGYIYGIYLSNFKAINVLKGNILRSKKMILLRNLMLGIQFFISGLFLISGFVIYAQVNFMNTKDLGFNGDQVLIVTFNSTSNNYWSKYELIKSKFINYTGIESISSSFQTPGANNNMSLDIDYKDKVVDTRFVPLDFGHFEMIKASFDQGRSFNPSFSSDTINAVVFNKTAIRQLGIENPIGKIVPMFNKQLKIIGVVNDYHVLGMEEEIPPMFFLHFKSIPWFRSQFNAVHFKLKKENIAQSIHAIEQFWNTEIEPGFPFSYQFLDQQFAKTYEKYEKQQLIFFILTLIVISIALLGLFALSKLTIQQRLKEVAIRKTLGASSREIIIPLTKKFLKIVVIASIILIPIAFYGMQQWLNNFTYRIDMPYWPYIITPVILLLLVLLIVGTKAKQATRINLIHYLKFE